MTRTDFAGKNVRIKDNTQDPMQGSVVGGAEYQVEGYWDEITKGSWMHANGNPAAMHYAIRSAHNGLPLDNEVLYGKIGPFGHLVHVSEIVVD